MKKNIDFFQEKIYFGALFLLLTPCLISTVTVQSNDQKHLIRTQEASTKTRGCCKPSPGCFGPRGPVGFTGAIGAIGAAGIITNGFNTINQQVFTTTGIYTATPGAQFAIVEAIGGGGGSGGCAATLNAASAGGGSGGYSRSVVTTASINGLTVTVGTGGAGGAVGGFPGSSGSPSSIGSIIANGGDGSVAGTTAAQVGGNAGSVGFGDFAIAGETGGNSNPVPLTGNSGAGGNSHFGFGGTAEPVNGPSNGTTGSNYGSGAGGSTPGAITSLLVPVSGAAGADGVVIITEFII